MFVRIRAIIIIKEEKFMIIGMPIVTFFAILIWPFVYTVLAFVVYFAMKKQDEQIDDTEFGEVPVDRKEAKA